MYNELAEFLNAHRLRVEQVLDQFLPPEHEKPSRLHQAMRYSVLLGGKRIRPCLVYATGYLFGTTIEKLDAPAAALELIHAYSLIHDDLPAMDNDDLRRGMPTCHRKFDEATAILAGDALQALAFEILTRNTEQYKLALRGVYVLAKASGSVGMVGGQAIDLEAVGNQPSAQELEAMHLFKTGALISASLELGAIYSGIEDENIIQKLRQYARCIGLAFQVQDDILDVEGNTDTIGKTQGSDIDRNKPTYVSLYGIRGAKSIAKDLHQQAVDCLSSFGETADMLRNLSAYIVQRDR